MKSMRHFSRSSIVVLAQDFWAAFAAVTALSRSSGRERGTGRFGWPFAGLMP